MTTRRTTPLKTEDIEPQVCTVPLRLEILSRVPFFAGLSIEGVAEINELFHEEGYAADETITALDIVTQRLKAAHEMIRQLIAHPVERRIASVLLELTARLGEIQEEGH